MRIEMMSAADVPPAMRGALRALSAAVYPPEVVATLPGRDLAWARQQQSILVWEDGRLVAHVGLVVREVVLDGQGMRIGGIGGVMTHPAAQRQGYASAMLRRAADCFASDPAIAFALLCCPPQRVSFYGSAGGASAGRSSSRNRAGPSSLPSTRCWYAPSTAPRPNPGPSTSAACRGRLLGLPYPERTRGGA